MRRNGGAERDRTVGLLNAIQALSQLSYSPTEQKSNMEKREMSKRLVPEVGIPSTCSGQAPRHGVEAPRDFESGVHPFWQLTKIHNYLILLSIYLYKENNQNSGKSQK